jgi:RNA polymerase subunit RPABC4/transcription elongation factor Spt4
LIAEHHAVIEKDFLVIGELSVEAVQKWFGFAVVTLLEESQTALE